MIVTLEDKCEAKVKTELAKTSLDLLMIKVPSTVFITYRTKSLSKVTLSTQSSYGDNEQDKFVGKNIWR